MACPCKRTMKVLAALGARQAAATHGKPGSRATTRQNLIHLREEEDYLFPIMLRLGMVKEVRELGDDHNRFRDQVRRYGKINQADFDHHAKREEKYILMVEPYLPQILTERNIAIARR